jgi:uncharacterized protein YeaO (DUF488 family)
MPTTRRGSPSSAAATGPNSTIPKRAAALARLRQLAAGRTVTVLTATKDIDISQAAVLADLLRQ